MNFLKGAALCAAALFTTPALAEFPEKPIRIIVPYAAGGASDNFARILQKGISDLDLLSVPVIVENIDGGGSAIGMRAVKDAEPDGYTLLLHHLTTHAAPAFGVIDFGWEAYEPVAQLAVDPLVYIVMDDSGYTSLKSFLDAAAAEPGTLKEATAFGTTIHVGSMMLDGAYEAQYGTLPERTLVQAGGTAQRLPLLMGEHLQGSFLTVGEYANYQHQGVKGLAIFTDERSPLLPDMPTAKEQGVDMTLSQTYWMFAPKGTPEDRVDLIADVLEKALDSDAVKKAFATMSIEKSYLAGPPLEEALAEVSANITEAVEKYGQKQ